MKKDQVLDVPSIQKAVSEKHKKFTTEYSAEIEKVIADHSLFADILLTKLYRIVLIFKEEGIINDIKISEFGPYKKLILYKNHCNNYVEIITNGKDIAMEGYSYSNGFNGFSSDFKLRYPVEKIYDVNIANFNWVDFSTKLLDYIHAVIYERNSVVEARLHGMFEKNVPEDDDHIVVDNTKKNKGRKS